MPYFILVWFEMTQALGFFEASPPAEKEQDGKQYGINSWCKNRKK